MTGSDNYLIRLAFNGGAYHGFQVQSNALSVCAVLQQAMWQVLGYRPDVKGCSRTDAGVHARDFCVSFHSPTNIPPPKLPLAINSRLPGDIRVFSAQKVPMGFHARYAATGKEYRYYIRCAAIDDPFTCGTYYRVTQPVDVDKMNAAAACLEGKHDFAAFMGAGGEAEDTTRIVTKLIAERQGEVITLIAAADGFLYHMVRILAGTLLAAGLGSLPVGAMPAVLAGKKRRDAGPTLPAGGLFLHRVDYPPEALVLDE